EDPTADITDGQVGKMIKGNYPGETIQIERVTTSNKADQSTRNAFFLPNRPYLAFLTESENGKFTLCHDYQCAREVINGRVMQLTPTVSSLELDAFGAEIAKASSAINQDQPIPVSVDGTIKVPTTVESPERVSAPQPERKVIASNKNQAPKFENRPKQKKVSSSRGNLVPGLARLDGLNAGSSMPSRDLERAPETPQPSADTASAIPGPPPESKPADITQPSPDEMKQDENSTELGSVSDKSPSPTEGKVILDELSTSAEPELAARAVMEAKEEEFAAAKVSAPKPIDPKRLQWPGQLPPPAPEMTKATFKSNLSSEGAFVYHTKHFQFTMHGEYPLPEWQVEEMAQVFEATHTLLQQSPVGVHADSNDERFQVYLFDSTEAYEAAGGPEMGSGAYLVKEKKFLLPVERKTVIIATESTKHLGEKFMTVKYSDRSMAHELTHMMMHDTIRHIPMWFVEGTAEYVEEMPRVRAVYLHDRMNAGIKFVSERYKDRLGFPEPIAMKDLLTMNTADWMLFIGDDNKKQRCIYYSSFLLSAYFIREETENVVKMLDNTANLPAPADSLNILLDGRSPEEVGELAENWMKLNNYFIGD
ncbi:MAG: hypothetical protein AAF226_09385, partial [Verrucomicrobiota bacterium]